VENLSSTQTLSLSSGSWEIQESDELQHSLHLSQQCRRHGPGRARGRGHAVGDQVEEEGEEATELGERDEDADSDSDADGDDRGDAGAVRGKAVDAEDEEGAEDEERE
jgi:hypothetical protein